ncbi:MAG: hypothetical protein QXE96_03175 [Candidatus Caldarchaeum sp.]
MPLQELVSLIEQLKNRIRTYQKDLQSSEALTRYVLIDPLLRALGWDTEDPRLVRPEVSTQAGRPDYALFQNGQRLAFVGAKPLGKQEDLLQQISYCVSEGVRYFIATDGSRWEVYDTSIQKPLQEKKIVDWDIQSMDAGEVVRRAFAIMRYAGINGPAQKSIITDITEKITQPTGGTPLSDFSPKLGDRLKYTKIIFPDGKSYQLKWWRDILTAAVEWLDSTGKLPQPPIKTGEGTTYLVNIRPVHENGEPFRSKRAVGKLFVETNYNIRDIVKHAVRLLELSGVSPREVFLTSG